MHAGEFRKLINLVESRIDGPHVSYEDSTTKVIAKLRSYNSQTYTKLAIKFEQMSLLEEEIKELKAEIKASTKEDIADLFDAADAIKTRVVETVSFTMTLSKDPKPTVSPKYKDILDALTEHLTPELIAKLEELKTNMVTVTQKSPSLKIEPVAEGFVGGLFAKFKNFILNWGNKYDRKLNQLRRLAGSAKV